jgi:tRNA 2-thiouridine synthesizing protein E
MAVFLYKGKEYAIDVMNFLINSEDWDENFAEGMAPQLGIPLGLTKDHWLVIRMIRKVYLEEGDFPNIYETCSACGLRIPEMRKLFPSGYWRGACKLAGIIPWKGPNIPAFHPINLSGIKTFIEAYDKTYEVDARGFLVNPEEWDEYYAANKAMEMKMPEGTLNEKHWKIITYLREQFRRNREVPTVYETCEDNQIGVKELERLFPDGYHRGAVKLAGLRISGPPSRF